ncbi:MAG: SCP2 sterol-binding domain-containing protein [Actinomycetia bacterium]|nr:SCP2 sterol-binding domain-containing protein [Actinomycetota bacterium]MCG2796612.1 SCP2 sterol-binding domain-containing protein [Actinomycetes bacterium]MBU4358815.1 SCP2 sterol-binding domain-containing protein [Actinomycetota bacterium]MBU4392522.1 SCP2 sterol-binding domain-containing protein [Actinomycetota bacterium]MBU4401574.1 SCP2 sterol-binding domain-containing protein [Actinomycetota bacterium]
MPYFDSIDTMYECIQELFDRLSDDPDIKEKALASKLIVNFIYRDPDGEVWIDCTGDSIELTPGKSDLTADATLTMDTDIAHKFWLGKLNLIKALTSGDIESEGSVPKLLKLLPVIKPAFKIYPEILKEKGLESIIDVS